MVGGAELIGVSSGGGAGRARSRDDRRRGPEVGRAVFCGPNIDACIIAGFPKGGAKVEGDVGSPSIICACGWGWLGCACIVVADPGVTGDRVDSGGVGYEVVFSAGGAAAGTIPFVSAPVLLG